MFRIISGEFRRRQMLTPKDAETTRPIPDRVKESLFQLLRGHYEGSAVFDAFAGTGPIGLEALSRGATRVVMVEKDREVFKLLEANIKTLGVEDRVEAVCGDALGAGAAARCPRPVHLAFFDPPYPLVRDALGWARVKAQVEKVIQYLDDDGYAILRTPWPFVHEKPDAVALVETEAPRFKNKKRRAKDRGRGADLTDRWLTDEEIVEATASPQGEESDEPELKPEVESFPVDLRLEGAVGPETHEYASMAVHLYMKKKA